MRDRLLKRFYDQLENGNWAQLDAERYWEKCKELNLTRGHIELALPVRLC